MLDIANEAKELYKQSSIPKSYSIVFPSLTITNDQLVAGGFSLEESLFTGTNIKFGTCESGMIKFTVADVSEDLKGQECTITQTIGEYEIPIGKYVVTECKKQNNKRFKDITAYDHMKLFDKDVSGWYKGLTFPLPLAQFRASLLAHIGITEVAKTLPNDTMSVSKTIDPSQISGRDIIQACEEINGCFGHMDRNGQFKHIILKTMHEDYPQNDYPGVDYPEDEPYDEYIDMSQYTYIDFEEYRVAPIDKIQIRQEENDVGVVYGTGANSYIIQGNFLVYGKTEAELQTIAANMSQNMFYRGYRPYKASNIGLPYVEVGDFVKYNANDTTAGFVFERILSGIQGLLDEYSANGEEEISQAFGQGSDIVQAKGRMTKIEKSVEGVKVIVSDMDTRLSGEIDVLGGQVVLKVDTNGNIGYIVLDGDPDTDLTSITVKANNISLEGLVTVNSRFKVLADGSIEAVNGKFSGDITGAIISGSSFLSEGTLGATSIVNGEIITDYVQLGDLGNGGDYQIVLNPSHILLSKSTGKVTNVSPEFISCNELRDVIILNGGTPITDQNKDQFTYPVAPHSHSGEYATVSDYNNAVTAINDLAFRVSALEG